MIWVCIFLPSFLPCPCPQDERKQTKHCTNVSKPEVERAQHVLIETNELLTKRIDLDLVVIKKEGNYNYDDMIINNEDDRQ